MAAMQTALQALRKALQNSKDLPAIESFKRLTTIASLVVCVAGFWFQ